MCRLEHPNSCYCLFKPSVVWPTVGLVKTLCVSNRFSIYAHTYQQCRPVSGYSAVPYSVIPCSGFYRVPLYAAPIGSSCYQKGGYTGLYAAPIGSSCYQKGGYTGLYAAPIGSSCYQKGGYTGLYAAPSKVGFFFKGCSIFQVWLRYVPCKFMCIEQLKRGVLNSPPPPPPPPIYIRACACTPRKEIVELYLLILWIL